MEQNASAFIFVFGLISFIVHTVGVIQDPNNLFIVFGGDVWMSVAMGYIIAIVFMVFGFLRMWKEYKSRD